MEIDRKLHKVGKLGNDNHNMTLIVHTLSPDQQNHNLNKNKNLITISKAINKILFKALVEYTKQGNTFHMTFIKKHIDQ